MPRVAHGGVVMSVQEVREVVEKFLSQSENEVLAIKGTWGVGKTFAWHRLVTDFKSIITPKTYCYVSLFGIASIADLRMSILSNSTPTESIGTGLTLSSIKRNFRSVAVAKANALRRKFSDIDGGAVLKDVYVTLDALTPSLIRDRLICLDDFERLDTDKLSHDALLGFITTLKETADCKIALILNDAQVPEQDGMYPLYREKVIDKEIKFDPTVEEAIAWGLEEDMPHYQHEGPREIVGLKKCPNIKKGNERCSCCRASDRREI
jgi:Cdc6-like AAA superfamily ATPase